MGGSGVVQTGMGIWYRVRDLGVRLRRRWLAAGERRERDERDDADREG